MMDVEALRARFLADLARSGTVHDPAWQAAFQDIPREHFVPYFFTQTPERPGWELVEGPSPEWLDGVYSMRALITQIDGDDANVARARTGRVHGVATSSSSSPTLMAVMVHALDVQTGHRVLEVGTGTGYNAALLCHRLGSGNVTSIDIDQGLVDRARDRLGELGYFPHLETADGVAGCPSRAPFDRIIATVGLARVPRAWIEQTTPGGKILVPLDLHGRGGLLAVLTVKGDGTAEGPFLPDFGGFMSLRDHQHSASAVLSTVDRDWGDVRTTTLPVAAATDPGDPFEFFAALIVGGYDWLSFTPSDGSPTQTWLTQPGGSWVCHVTNPDGTHIVRQGGPKRLWDGIEAAYREWQQLGQPPRERFGMTVSGDQHTVWLDHPESPAHWDLSRVA